MKAGPIIVILFVVVAAIVIGVSQFLQSQPPLEFTVAVNSLAEDWLRDSIGRLNDTKPVVNATQRIQFNITVVDDLSVWQGTSSYTPENHPAAWIPTSSVSVNYSDRYDMVTPSLARTPLVWGGYASRVEVATDGGAAPLDWDSVQHVADAASWTNVGGQSSWGFLKLAFPRADMTMSGLGVLFSAAASHGDTADLSAGATRDEAFRSWMLPVIESVPNFQTLGADPAAAMARSPSTAEMALLPENLWLKNLRGLTDNEGFVFSYPAYQFMLDFPLAAWRSPLNELEAPAVQVLADWLTQPDQQASAVASGLRAAEGEPDSSATLFVAAESYGIMLEPDYGMLVTAPSRIDAASLVQWFSTNRR